MNTQLMIMAIILPMVLTVSSANAESVPSWIKNNAGWWADGTISESEFILAIQYLIKEEIITIPPTSITENSSEGIPDWVKNTASWWAQGLISDGEFVNAIQHLIGNGIIIVQIESNSDPQLDVLQKELEKCAELTRAYERSDCKRMVKAAIVAHDYKTNGQSYQVGPITFYYKGNDFVISQSGQAILSLSMLAENTGSDSNVSLMCTGPSICNYDVWNGDKAFKYSGMDFTNGQIVLKPGDTREFSMLFGPNIGYGGTTFEYDSTKEYVFRISEPWGETTIPLNLE